MRVLLNSAQEPAGTPALTTQAVPADAVLIAARGLYWLFRWTNTHYILVQPDEADDEAWVCPTIAADARADLSGWTVAFEDMGDVLVKHFYPA